MAAPRGPAVRLVALVRQHAEAILLRLRVPRRPGVDDHSAKRTLRERAHALPLLWRVARPVKDVGERLEQVVLWGEEGDSLRVELVECAPRVDEARGDDLLAAVWGREALLLVSGGEPAGRPGLVEEGDVELSVEPPGGRQWEENGVGNRHKDDPCACAGRRRSKGPAEVRIDVLSVSQEFPWIHCTLRKDENARRTWVSWAELSIV